MTYTKIEDRRASAKRHYQKHPEYYRERNKRRQAEFTRIIRENKDRPCMDCGIKYPYFVMDFDHRDPAEKRFNIGMLNQIPSIKGLLVEIAKCDVVCSNCHRIRTHRSLGELADPPGSEPGDTLGSNPR